MSILTTIIACIALAAAVFFAIRYIVREKRKGTRCIGCPFADQCGSCAGGQRQSSASGDGCPGRNHD